jgi:hypothetical protein
LLNNPYKIYKYNGPYFKFYLAMNQPEKVEPIPQAEPEPEPAKGKAVKKK